MFLQTFGTAITNFNLVPTPAPNIAYFAPNVGTFVLTDSNSTANFVWQYNQENIEFHSQKLNFKGIRTVSNVKYYECEILLEIQEGYKEIIKLLFACKRASIDPGYRIFYRRPHDQDYQLWAWEAEIFKLDQPGKS